MATLKLDRVIVNNFVLLLTFYLLLFFCFALVVRDEYAFKKVDLTYIFDLNRTFIGLAWVIVGAAILSIASLKGFHYAITALILIFFVFPSTVIFSYVKESDFRIPLSHYLLFLTVLILGKIKIKIRLPSFRKDQSKKILILVVVIGLIPFIVLFLPHLNFNNLLLREIYETREQLGLAIDTVYTNYSYSWFNKFIIPCLLVFSIYYRDRFTAFIGSGALIFLYLCGAHKAVFIGLILTFVLYKFEYKTKINYLLKLLMIVGAFSLFMAIVFKVDFFMTMTLRRAFLLPAMVDVLYFDMFDNNHMLWSETFNGLFRTYPYELEHSFMIGKRYFGEVIWGANNGIISEGFMNGGMLGVLINVGIVGIYFSILNQLNISPKFFGLFFAFVFLIVSSSLPTVMVSHGGIVLMLIALLFMKNTTTSMT
jgi:hypothetical protein